MPQKSKIDWQDIDWHRGNTEIARALSVSPWTVLAQRHRHAPETIGKYRSPRIDTDAMAEQMRRVRNSDTQWATEAAKRSKKAGKGRNNVHAKQWLLVAPDGRKWHVQNLHHFIRTHPELFEECDRQWRRTGGKRGTGGEYCRASAGIQNIRAGKTRSWKGWTLLP